MVFKLFRRLFRRSPLDLVSIEELRERKIELENMVRKVKSKIEEIDKEMELVLESAESVETKLDEMILARKLKGLELEKTFKLGTQAKLERELRIVSNLIIVKEYQKDLESAGAWDKLKKMDPIIIVTWLEERNFEEMSRDEIISQVVAMTSGAIEVNYREYKPVVTPTSREQWIEQRIGELFEDSDEPFKVERDVIRAIKEGKMEVRDAKRVIDLVCYYYMKMRHDYC